MTPAQRAAVVFLVVSLLYVGPALLPGKLFIPLDIPRDFEAWKPSVLTRVRVSNSLLSDVVVAFLPWDTEVVRLIRAGRFPWRNPLADQGAPLFANPQTALFSPFMWPRFVLGPGGWALMALMKFLVAGVGMFWLVREAGGTSFDATFSGVVFMASGYLVTTLLFAHSNVLAILPCLGAISLRFLNRPSPKNGALTILFAALATAGGHPETLMLGVCGIAAWLGWEASRPSNERRSDFPGVIPIAITWALGFLLLSVELLPFLFVLSRSYSRMMRPLLPGRGFRFTAVLGQVLPGYLGSPLKNELDFTSFLPILENFLQRNNAYIGFIVLVSLLSTVRSLPQIFRRGLIVGSVGLLLSLRLPGLREGVAHIPLVRLAAVEYFALIFVVFACAASGPALTRFAATPRRSLGIALVAVGLLLCAAGTAPLLPQTRPLLLTCARLGIEHLRERGLLHLPPAIYEQRLQHYLIAGAVTALRRIAIPGACWAVAGFALVLPLRRRKWLLATAAIAELLAFGVGFNPVINDRDAAPTPEVVRTLRRLDPTSEWLIASHVEVFPANLGTLYGIREILSYDVLTDREQITTLLRAGYDPVLHTFPENLSASRAAVLADLGVRYVISRVPVPSATRIEIPVPSGAMLYELRDPKYHPRPENIRPEWFDWGLIMSIISLVLSLSYIWLLRAPPAAAVRFER